MRSKNEQFSIDLERPIRKGFVDDVGGIKFRMRPLSLIMDVDRLGTSTAIDRAFDPAAFGDTFQAVVSAYHISGRRAAKQANTSFSLGERQVADFIAEYVQRSIASISQSQKVDITVAIQQRLAEGWSPAKITRELLGRKVGTTYQGGLLGLSQNGIKSSNLARDQLLAFDKDYFNRKLRATKYDSLIEKAIRSGKPLTAKQLEAIIASYQANLLKARAKMIALMETTTAVNATKLRTFTKAANAAGVPLDLLDKSWHTVGDSHVRFTHKAMSTQVVTLTQKFVSPSGALMEYPGDPSAPLSERAGCRCHMSIRWDKSKK